MRQMSDVANSFVADLGNPKARWSMDDAQVKPVTGRAFNLTPLDGFKFDHLQDQWQIDRLRHALDRCNQWQEQAKRYVTLLDAYERKQIDRQTLVQSPAYANRGLSMIIAGSYGTGKTTMVTNIMEAYNYHAVVEGIDEVVTVSRARFFEVNDLMRSIPDNHFAETLKDTKVVVIDDAGWEDFSTATYTTPEDQERKYRHLRYGRFVDWAYRNGVSLLITSNVPMVNRDGSGKPTGMSDKFVDIFGERAFDRLIQMTSGYAIDLTGLPSYRPQMVKGIM